MPVLMSLVSQTTTLGRATMAIQLHAQPYSIDAAGFYFSTIEEYETKSTGHVDRYSQPVEEYEIQFIDGDDIECELAKAMGLSQANLASYFGLIDEQMDEYELHRLIIALDNGYGLDADLDDIEVYYEDDLTKLAEQFIDDGLYGDIPDNIANYLDTERMGRDLSFDGYTEATVAGQRLVYRLR
jgi:hypothetical protein